MEGKVGNRIWIKIIITILFLSVITGQNGLFDIEIAADSTNRSTRGSGELNWTQTTQEDFMNGTATNMEIISTGEVKLAIEPKELEDGFNDETKIGFKENVEIDTFDGEASLVQIVGVYGGPDRDKGYSIQQTLDGGYIITGHLGGYNLVLLKTDEYGNEQWKRSFGFDYQVDYGFSVQQTIDGGFIVTGTTGSYGAGSGDLWLIKTNESGNEEWNKTYGGIWGDSGNSVKQTGDNGFIITGSTQSYGNGSNGNSDVWLIKTDEFGNEEWNRTFGETEPDGGAEIVITSDLGYMIIASSYYSGIGWKSWLIKTGSLGNEQWRKTFGGAESDICQSIKQTSDDGYVIAGNTQSFGSVGWDLWLIKTDASGNEQWNRTFGRSGNDYGESVLETIDGGYAITGYTDSYGVGGYDVWLIKTDGNGNELWNRTYGGGDIDCGRSLRQVSDGGFVITGDTESYGAGNSDILLIKTDDFGNFPGTLISTNLLSGQNSHSIDAFDCLSSNLISLNMKVQFSLNNEDWYNSLGTLNGWDEIPYGSNHIDLSLLGWSGSDFYYKINFTSDIIINLPKLDRIKLIFSQYFSNGALESEIYDSNTYPVWKILNWTATVPPETELKFQTRTADAVEHINEQAFVGPNGSSETFFNTSGQTIWSGHERDRFIQYKAYLATSNTSVSPVLEEVSITYEPIDTDGDGVVDFDDEDDDNDDMPDTWEFQYGLDPLNQSDANFDSDLDGLTNLQEFLNYTKPTNNDTDGDSLGDGFEVIVSKTNASLWDTNGNGIGDGLEFIQSKGYLGWIQSLSDDWIGMTITWDNYTILVKTNSSLLEGEFDKEEQKLKIKVSGPNGTQGVTEIDVPKSLCEPEDIEIIFDGELINYTLTQDDTYYYIHIEYNHSVHELMANLLHISELPSEPTGKEEGILANIYLMSLIIALIIIVLLSIVIIRTRGKSEDIGVQELPPEKLSILLDKKHAEGKITDETYNDAKSLLEKYLND